MLRTQAAEYRDSFACEMSRRQGLLAGNSAQPAIRGTEDGCACAGGPDGVASASSTRADPPKAVAPKAVAPNAVGRLIAAGRTLPPPLPRNWPPGPQTPRKTKLARSPEFQPPPSMGPRW